LQKVCLVCPLAFHCCTRENMASVFVVEVIVF
jgi:hypothetical protein